MLVEIQGLDTSPGERHWLWPLASQIKGKWVQCQELWLLKPLMKYWKKEIELKGLTEYWKREMGASLFSSLLPAGYLPVSPHTPLASTWVCLWWCKHSTACPVLPSLFLLYYHLGRSYTVSGTWPSCHSKGSIEILMDKSSLSLLYYPFGLTEILLLVNTWIFLFHSWKLPGDSKGEIKSHTEAVPKRMVGVPLSPYLQVLHQSLP